MAATNDEMVANKTITFDYITGLTDDAVSLELNMVIHSFKDALFVHPDNIKKLYTCLWEGALLIAVHKPAWAFIQKHSHTGAYGSLGAGFYHATATCGVDYVVVRKIAIDVESILGYRWCSPLFESVSTPFVVPYGTAVNVGRYALTPYLHEVDSFGFDETDDVDGFDKWRKQVSADYFGVHFLQRDALQFAFIPSVVIQFAGGITVHYECRRTATEEPLAKKMVALLRAHGISARDVHTKHHGIAMLNHTPRQFVQHLQTDPIFATLLANTFRMKHWIDSYIATFGETDID